MLSWLFNLRTAHCKESIFFEALFISRTPYTILISLLTLMIDTLKPRKANMLTGKTSGDSDEVKSIGLFG